MRRATDLSRCRDHDRIVPARRLRRHFVNPITLLARRTTGRECSRHTARQRTSAEAHDLRRWRRNLSGIGAVFEALIHAALMHANRRSLELAACNQIILRSCGRSVCCGCGRDPAPWSRPVRWPWAVPDSVRAAGVIFWCHTVAPPNLYRILPLFSSDHDRWR